MVVTSTGFNIKPQVDFNPNTPKAYAVVYRNKRQAHPEQRRMDSKFELSKYQAGLAFLPLNFGFDNWDFKIRYCFGFSA